MQTDVELQPLAVAKLLKAVVDKEKPEICILGKQAIDDDANQTGQMLAALLGWSQGCFASKLVLNGDGTAKVTRGEDTFLLAENESTYIPLGTVHRLHNPGKVPLEIIEVQSGSYLGEDDIVRFEDTYGRN